MSLAMKLPIALASSPFTANETEFRETMLSPEVRAIAVVDVVPSTLESNTKMRLGQHGELL